MWDEKRAEQIDVIGGREREMNLSASGAAEMSQECVYIEE